LKTICVYCGANPGNHPQYAAAARALGQAMVAQNLALVYGGGNVGLMGVLASQALASGGEVVGVIPQSLKNRELAHSGLSELIVVQDMHERKLTMAGLADGFIAMPGAAGTLEEIFEAWTWAQLGYHTKPCAFFNMDGYFDTLLSFVDQMVSSGFMAEEYRDMLIVSDDPEVILAAFKTYTPPGEKWH